MAEFVDVAGDANRIDKPSKMVFVDVGSVPHLTTE